MRPAAAPPQRRGDVRMLVVADRGEPRDGALDDLLDLLRPEDVLVLNDAATLPASLHGQTCSGADIELRLLGPVSTGRSWRGVVFGAGDWHTPTEHRPLPPRLQPGDGLAFQGGLGAEVTACSALSDRLIDIRFDRGGSELWQALYRAGRPVQYSYLRDDLALWSVQTVYGARPWAVEMPSAGRPLTWSLLLALRRRGVILASLTHAAGLSSTGDPVIDRALPLPERFDIPLSTVRAIARAGQRGGRVIAVGTTVVRALEGNAVQHGGELCAGTGTTDLVIDRSFRPAVVDGILTGVHDPSQSHFHLLSAFADENTLERAWRAATQLGYRCHEFGDSSLIVSERRSTRGHIASLPM